MYDDTNVMNVSFLRNTMIPTLTRTCMGKLAELNTKQFH